MVPISQKVYALDEIWKMDFDKYPLASHYNEYPFLIFENALNSEKTKEIINSLKTDEKYQAGLVGSGIDEEIRKTILHKPTFKIRKVFEEVIQKYKDKIEKFYGVSLLKGTDIQILEYRKGGHYKRHADNASEIYKDNKLSGYKVVKPERKITTLLFLNDNFEGGEIEFCHLRYNDGNVVRFKPKTGELIVFPSHGLFAHKVYPVTKGKRFAIVKWWDVV